MGLFSNRIEREELLPGDHIYTWRTAYIYAHHGIYCGDDKVIHFTRGRNEELGTGTFLDSVASTSRPPPTTTTCETCGTNAESRGVVMSCLDCFLLDCPLYRFGYGTDVVTFVVKARGGTCTTAESDSPALVLHRAYYLLNHRHGFGGYDVFRNNCEDFAIYCKTGLMVMERVGRSGQAISFLGIPLSYAIASPLSFLFATPLGVAAATAGVYSFSRYAADIGVRTDVLKVEVEDLAVNLGWQQP